MALFGRRHREAEPEAEPAPDNEGPDYAELAQAASTLGLHPIDETGFGSGFLDHIMEASRCSTASRRRHVRHAPTPRCRTCSSPTCSASTIDRDAITVANVRTPMEAMSLEYMAKVHSTSLVVLER
jgi:hypothetical protein